jgi:hypothetical protein
MGFMGITLERYIKADQTRSAFFLFVKHAYSGRRGGGKRDDRYDIM